MFGIGTDHRTLPLIGVLVAALVLLSSACGDSSDDSSDADDHGGDQHSGHHGDADPSEETEDPYDVEVPAGAPDVPDPKALKAKGFDCREAGNQRPFDPEEEEPWLEGQSHLVCLFSNGTINAEWDMVLYKDKVVGMSYDSEPLVDVSVPAAVAGVKLSHKTALGVVFDTLMPQDRSRLGPALAEWTTPKDTRTWTFEGTGHAAFNPPGFMTFEAELADLGTSMSLADGPGATGPTFDPAALQKATADGDYECTMMNENEVSCEFGDVFTLTASAHADGVMSTFDITPWLDITPKHQTKLLATLRDLAKRSESPELSKWLRDLAAELAGGKGKRLVWVGDQPTVIDQRGTTLEVEARMPVMFNS